MPVGVLSWAPHVKRSFAVDHCGTVARWGKRAPLLWESVRVLGLSSSTTLLGDRFKQRLHTTTHILRSSIHEEPRSSPQMGASSALLVFSHTLPVNFIVQLGGKPRHIQADLAREAVQMVPGQ